MRCIVAESLHVVALHLIVNLSRSSFPTFQSMRTLIRSHEVDTLYRASELCVSVVGHNVDNAKHVYI